MGKTKNLDPVKRRTFADVVADAEKAKGAVPPHEVLMLCKMWRSASATNEAQKKLIKKLGREIVEWKKVVRSLGKTTDEMAFALDD